MKKASRAKTKQSKNHLTKKDLDLLHGFRISDDLINAAKIHRVDDVEARAEGFKFDPDLDLSGVVFPYLDADGTEFNARLRRDNPEVDEDDKEINKCISKPRGTRRGLYWAPGARELLAKHPDWEIVAVEAEKSALAGMSARNRANRNCVFVATGGSQGWRDKKTGVVSDLDLLAGHAVAVMLDGNVAENEKVKAAELELAEYLSRIGARVRCLRVPVLAGVNGPDDFIAKKSDPDFWKLFTKSVEPWIDTVGESYEKYLSVKPPEFVIKDFLQTDGAMLIGGLSESGKTFALLSMVQSLLTGEKLFGHFQVNKKAERVIYLSPEITLSAFKHRAEKFNLGPFIKSRQLIIRTLSAYPMVELTDPALLLSARGCDVFLDTVVRFGEGDENSSTDNDRGLAAGIFRLLQSGARTVTGSAHSPKGLEAKDYLTLENVLRGSGDIGAMLSAAWAMRMIDRDQTRVFVQNIKARDFAPPPSFLVQGKPHVDAGKGLQMVVEPGHCGALSEYVGKKTGRPADPVKAERTALLEEMVKANRTTEEIAAAVAKRGWDIKPSTLKKEIQAAKPRKF